MKKTLMLFSIFLMIISLAYASESHVFYVNKYYVSSAPQNSPEGFYIEPVASEKSIDSCGEADFSFKLKNYGESQVFRLNIEDFKGIAYYSNSLIMGENDLKLIQVKLKPDCSVIGTINPKVVIETDEEKAVLPLLLHISGSQPVSENNCLYYYNSTVCGSAAYVRIIQGNTYVVDLGDMFYDPDEDSLTYDAKASSLDVTIKGDKAEIKPKWHYTGAEKVTFNAEDGKGGIAYSKTYYFQVVSNERGFLLNFLLGNWIWVAVIVVLCLIILLLLIFK